MRRYLAALLALLLVLVFPLQSHAADDDMARLYTFTSGTTIQSSQVNGEFDQLITKMNTKMSRGGVNTVTGNNTFSGDNTHSGTNTFSNATSPIKTDKILEYTGAAGVTIDSLLIKDAGVRFTDAGELTIASGAITATGSFHTVDTESDAASDDLDTINGGTAGAFLIIQAENDNRTVVVKHNTGNILLTSSSDMTLDEDDKSITLVYSAALSKWCEVARTSIGASAATQAEQETGSSTSVYVSPGRQQYHPSAAKAWTNFNGTGTLANNASYNVSSITDNGTGTYTVNFTNSFSSTSYAAVVSISVTTTDVDPTGAGSAVDRAVGSVRIDVENSSSAQLDVPLVDLVIYGDL